MKFLQTGDWHLGKVFYEQSLLEDQKCFLDQVSKELADAEDNGSPYDALVVPGDIYDRAVPPAEAVTLFSSFLNRIRTVFPRLHLFFLAGNHDSAERLSFAAELLENQNIHICTGMQHFTEPVLVGSGSCVAAVYQLPYLTPGCVAIPQKKNPDMQNSLFNTDAVLRSQQQLAEEAVRQIWAAHQKKYQTLPAVLCAHLFTLGAVSSDSERLFTGAAEQVDASIFAPFVYTALGHLHKAQKCGSGSVQYSGSPLAYSFGEEPSKYMLCVTVTEDGAKAERIPVQPLHPVVTLAGTFEQFYSVSDSGAYRNCYVEIQCTDTAVHENAMALLRTKYPLLLSFTRSTGGQTAEDASLAERRKLLQASRKNSGDIFDLFIRDMYGETSCGNTGSTDSEKKLFIELAQQEGSL